MQQHGDELRSYGRMILNLNIQCMKTDWGITLVQLLQIMLP